MIFVTIGSMFPFDRLVRAMDAWAAMQPGREILAQIGDGRFEPAHMRWVRRLERADYLATVARAELVVAHAGVGSVATAGEFGKPIVVLPRRGRLGEHTSDHQRETATWLKAKAGVFVADTEAELAARLAEALAAAAGPRGCIARSADPAFIARLRRFILE